MDVMAAIEKEIHALRQCIEDAERLARNAQTESDELQKAMSSEGAVRKMVDWIIF